MGVSPTGMTMYHSCVVTIETRMGSQTFGAGVTDGCQTLCECCESN